MKHVSRPGAIVAIIILAGCGPLLKLSYAAQMSLSSMTEAQGVAQIKKLAFMAGTWKCVSHGGSSQGFLDTLTYSFSPDGHWMTETEHTPAGRPVTWSEQMWGFDAQQGKLVAYQFTPRGVATKSVSGWQNGRFVSKRDDNGATVSIRPKNKRAFDWVITPADGSSTVVQACTR